MKQYTLITAKGKVLVFTVEACALLYQTINGGTIVGQEVLDIATV